MQNHNGYWKQNELYYVQDSNGLFINVVSHKIAQLEMISKGE